MKVVFKSSKEKNPLQHDGLNVFYGPGKRLQYKLRWYLILALVSSPLLWIVYTLARDALLVEAPARLHYPTYDIVANEDGIVGAKFVNTNADVQIGQQLFSVQNDTLEFKRNQISVELSSSPLQIDNAAYTNQSRLLQDKINKAQDLYDSHRRLSENGLITKSEVVDADRRLKFAKTQLFELNQQHQEREEYLRKQQQEHTSGSIERSYYDQKIARLNINTLQAGTVVDVAVDVGTPVKKGQLMATLRLSDEPEVWVYLAPKMAEYSAVGTPFSLVFPDGHAIGATVAENSKTVTSLPPSLRKAFSESNVGILVKANIPTSIGNQWNVDNLPLKARF